MSENSGERALELEEVVGEGLRAQGLNLAVAESCTGGLIGHRVTNVPGSSEYFRGGVLSYDNGVKQALLGVPQEVLDSVGAVSQECALAMAHGVRKLLDTSLALSATGIAGPGGATPGKPVGLVYIALVDRAGWERCERYVWPGERVENKELSALAALRLLADYLADHATL